MMFTRPISQFVFLFLAATVATAGCGGSDATSPGEEESKTTDGDKTGGKTSKDGGSSGDDTGGDGTGGDGTGGDGTGGDGTATPDGGSVGEDTDAGTNPGGGDPLAGGGKDVVTIGDSYMRISDGSLMQKPGNEGVELSLEKVSGRDYRNYGYTGVEVFPTQKAAAIVNGVIPGQFENAKKENADIKTVVVSGGGNDLTNDCNGAMTPAEVNDKCKKLLEDIEAGCQTLMKTFADSGVKDVVWVGYGKTEKTGGLQPRALDGAIQILREKRMANCKASDPSLNGLRCHYVDSRALTFTLRDGFHPDAAGFETIATAVWERMQKENVAR